MMDKDTILYYREKREAFRSLSAYRVMEFAKFHNVTWIPLTEGPALWIKIHQVRLTLFELPKSERQISYDWLVERGETPVYAVIDPITANY